MSRSSLKETIEFLDTARAFYEKETSQRAANQSTIHSWIERRSSIAQRVRSNPRGCTLTRKQTDEHSDSTQENEFNWSPSDDRVPEDDSRDSPLEHRSEEDWFDGHVLEDDSRDSPLEHRSEEDLLDTVSHTTVSNTTTTNVQNDATKDTHVNRGHNQRRNRIIFDTGD